MLVILIKTMKSSIQIYVEFFIWSAVVLFHKSNYRQAPRENSWNKKPYKNGEMLTVQSKEVAKPNTITQFQSQPKRHREYLDGQSYMNNLTAIVILVTKMKIPKWFC